MTATLKSMIKGLFCGKKKQDRRQVKEIMLRKTDDKDRVIILSRKPKEL